MLSLVNASLDKLYQIKWCISRGEGGSLLERLGIVQGADVRVVSSYFGNVIVCVDGKRIAIDRDLAAVVKI